MLFEFVPEDRVLPLIQDQSGDIEELGYKNSHSFVLADIRYSVLAYSKHVFVRQNDEPFKKVEITWANPQLMHHDYSIHKSAVNMQTSCLYLQIVQGTSHHLYSVDLKTNLCKDLTDRIPRKIARIEALTSEHILFNDEEDNLWISDFKSWESVSARKASGACQLRFSEKSVFYFLDSPKSTKNDISGFRECT